MIFREKIRPPLWLLAFIYFLLFSLVIAIWAALSSTATTIAFTASFAFLIYCFFALTTTIEISDDEISIDRAHIERRYISSVQVLSATEMRLLRTRDADPAAYLAIRFWEPRGVRLNIADSRDSTPYWLVTSKRGDEIAALLNS